MADSMAAAIGASANSLRTTADQLHQGATRTKHDADTVSASAQGASNCVVDAAFSADELSVSITAIGRQVVQSADIANRAAHEAQRTGQIMCALSESAQKVGQVVNLISGIAQQTNLLALNATIEAARSGTGGQGLRRGRGGSQDAGQPDGARNGRHRGPDRPHAGDHRRCRGRHRGQSPPSSTG